MGLSEAQKQELIKLQKIFKQYEGIVRTSRDPEQISRAKKEMKKIQDQIQLLAPEGVSPEDLVVSSQGSGKTKQFHVLGDFPMSKASPHCDDEEVNLLYTAMLVWEREFIPAQGDTHTKLDFSWSMERDSHYAVLENCKRHLKSLTDTLESYQKATRDDLKMQLRDMRQRYTRHFLQEGAQFFRKLRDFWKKVQQDIKEGGTRCLNKDDTIYFDRKLEQASYFQGKKVRDMVDTTVTFLEEVLGALNVPEMKSPQDKR
ncbi:MAG: hypothetical protein RML34_02895 [Leptospiraceae bacterium]|nr:hypothetical protein [Leptospiraceae bacterium]